MPLVISEASQCDVCLNNYDWTHPIEEERVVPGVIPCGHILCISCLKTISPPVCPFCRARYAAERVKKIHVDGVDQGTDEKKDLELLKQVFSDALNNIMEPVPPQVQARLSAEQRPSTIPLKDAHDIITRYKDLWLWYQEHEPRYRHYRAEYERLSLAHPSPPPLPALQPANLPTTKSGKSSKSRKIAELERMVAEMQLELTPYRMAQNQAHNPLPEPPAPISFSQVPSVPQFLSASQAGSASGTSSASSGSFGQRLVDDYSPPRKSRSHKNGERRVPINPYADPVPGPSTVATRDDHVVRSNRRGVIPGASPPKRFIPPAADYQNRLSHAATFVTAYGQGMQEAYQLASSVTRPGPAAEEARASGFVPSGALEGYGFRQAATTRSSSPPVAASSSRPQPTRRSTVQIDNQLATPRQPARNSLASDVTSSEASARTGSTWGTVSDQSSFASSLQLATFGTASLPVWPPVPGSESSLDLPVPFGQTPAAGTERLRALLRDPPSSSSLTQSASSRESLTGSVHGTSSERSSRRHRHPRTATSTIPEVQSENESHSSSSHRHRSGRDRTVTQEADTSNLVVGNPQFSATANAPPLLVTTSGNALGLAIGQQEQVTPTQIAAPTPRSSYRPFLRAFSDGPAS
ncbi:hypothetical protein DL96DRAFT_1616506 [Flagelloscypha sp. PMI_526]|nr:hypothetical protein DL96DRAFT_1616506 [Flagelloscypha sp. PMI_526]